MYGNTLIRTTIGIVAGVALSSACSMPSAFACAGDVQCRLDGIEGMCTEAGHCAYPDPDCDTGWGYPAGVAGVFGGTCAPGVPPEDGSVGGDETSDAGAGMTAAVTGTTSTTSDGSQGEASGSDPSVDPAESDATGDSFGSESGACPDAEPNDDPFALSPIELQQCGAVVLDEIDESFEPDWFQFVSTLDECGLALGLGTAMINVSAELCIFVQCSDGGEVPCGEGEPTFFDEFVGCCAAPVDPDGQVSVQSANCGPGQDYFVRVTGFDGSSTCEPYELLFVAQ